MTREELRQILKDRLNSGIFYTEESTRLFNEWHTTELIKIVQKEKEEKAEKEQLQKAEESKKATE